MKTRIISKVFILIVLSALALADEKEAKAQRKITKSEPEESYEDEDQESIESKSTPNLQKAAGFLSPVAFKYSGGGYGGGRSHQEVHQPKPYRFGYEIKDPHHGRQFRHEESNGAGSKKGSYGYRDQHGLYRVVDYVADHNGFRAAIRTNEPGTSNQNPAHVNVLSEYRPGLGFGHTGAIHAPTNTAYSAPKVPEAPIRHLIPAPQHDRFIPPPQPIRYVASAPQQVKYIRPQEVVPTVRFPHQQPPNQFSPPRQHLFRQPPQLRNIASPPPSHIVNSRPHVQLQGPIINTQSGPIRPSYGNPFQSPAHIGNLHVHNGPPLRPVGHQLQPVRERIHYQELRPIHAHGPIINQGPVHGPIINRGPVFNQGPVGGLHVASGPIQGPIIHQARAPGPYYGQNIPVNGDVASLKLTAGAPIINGPGVGHVYVEHNQKVEGLTRNIIHGISGGIRKGLRNRFVEGLRPAEQGDRSNVVSNFRQGFKGGFVQGLNGAHSGENGEGKEAVLPPYKNQDQAIYLGPFPGHHQGRKISHIVMSRVQNSLGRQPVEIPGQDPAFIGPGPAPKFDPSDLKKQTKSKLKTEDQGINAPKQKPSPKPEKLTTAASEYKPSVNPVPPVSHKPVFEIEFTLPFGK